MALVKRSIGASISNSVSAISTAIELAPQGLLRAGKVLSDTADVTEMYLDNWKKEKLANNMRDSVQRRAQMEELRLQAVAAGVTKTTTIEEFIAEVQNSVI